jgi:cyclopropane-fatty-acyl-phospholipid synthase
MAREIAVGTDHPHEPEAGSSAPLPAATPPGGVGSPVADVARPVIEALLGSPLQVRVEFWDGSALGPEDGAGPLHVRSRDAFRRLLWAPGELGLARAFVAGDLDADGSLVDLVTALRDRARRMPAVRDIPGMVSALRALGVMGAPPEPPAIEYRPPRSPRHTLRRDKQAISHHYDVSNEFYALVLGESMTYSCARFAEPDLTLAEAQASKHEHICRKLGLHTAPGSRLLDVGCGWGSLAIHAATHHRADVVGITISAEQAKLARERVIAAGVEDLVDIRLQDYRELGGETFDAVSSVGMFEHVGTARIGEYFEVLRRVVRPTGRLLNHAISSVGGSKIGSRSFIYRYVFPDGELIDVGDTVLAMEAAGFEVRDVESLREHYATTLRHWVANLESHWDDAVALVGLERARVWRLYMSGSVVGFEDGGINVHQVLGVVPTADGTSGMPRVRPA